MKVNARKEADIILSNAELQGEKIIANAQARRMALVGEIEELKRARGFVLAAAAVAARYAQVILDQMRATRRLRSRRRETTCRSWRLR